MSLITVGRKAGKNGSKMQVGANIFYAIEKIKFNDSYISLTDVQNAD